MTALDAASTEPHEVAGDPQSPMRIAVVIERYNPQAGGAEKSTAQIVEQLVQRGHAVTLIAGACKPDHDPPGVEVRCLAYRKSSSPIRLWRFARWAKRELLLLQADASLSITMAVPASVVQPRGGTIRETLERNIALRTPGWKQRKKRIEIALDPKQRLLLRLEKRTLNDPAVHAVACVSRYVAQQLHQHYAFPADRCVVIPNASVMPAMPSKQRLQRRDEIRHVFGIAEDATVFVFAAQNPKLKGIDTLLPALRSIVDRGKVRNPVLLLAGAYDFGVQQRVAELGLRDGVRLLGQTSDMAGLFAAGDITVLPSWYDPSSKVVLESLMMGVPAITTAFNGAGDHLGPSDHDPNTPVRGRVIADPRDAAALAAAMADLADPTEHARCVTNCAGLADQLSMARHVDALEALLREAAEARSNAPKRALAP
ncbi:MAG: glycosyltransferase family 4 protein [Planctomycetota bacterium]